MTQINATLRYEGFIYSVPGHLKRQITELLIPYVNGAVEEKPAASPKPPVPETTEPKKGKGKGK